VCTSSNIHPFPRHFFPHSSNLPGTVSTLVGFLAVRFLVGCGLQTWTPFGFHLLALFQILWLWGSVIRLESAIGYHTPNVLRSLISGFIWFILREVILFFRVFWAYLDRALAPRVQRGISWPPRGIEPVNSIGLPLLNTFLLLSSRITLTICHHQIKNNKNPIPLLILTILLGIIFLSTQVIEYRQSSFRMTDSIFGSVFYMGTGLHIAHVAFGTSWLLVNFLLLKNHFFTSERCHRLELSRVYWHLVDVIWLLLWLLIY